VVLSSRPGRVKAVIENTLPRPRHVSAQLSPEYLTLKARVWAEVEEEVSKHVELQQSEH
jgi:NitT/TauT family transport system ATP-binding protein